MSPATTEEAPGDTGLSEPGYNGGGAGFTGLSEPGDSSGGLVEYGLVGEAARSISEGSGGFSREKLQERVRDA